MKIVEKLVWKVSSKKGKGQPIQVAARVCLSLFVPSGEGGKGRETSSERIKYSKISESQVANNFF